MRAGRFFRTPWRVGILVLALVGCASTPPQEQVSEFQNKAMQARVDKLNMQLALQSAAAGVPKEAPESYRLGPEDLLEVNVFNVPALSREVRVDGQGYVTLPLVGEIAVAGMAIREVENLIAARYEESYLRNPQVSVLIKEHHSHRITVIGAVKEPSVYSVQRKIRLLEALALASGLIKEAGRTVYVTDQVLHPESRQRIQRNLVINLDELIRGDSALNVALGEGAVVNVPQAGVVYVEGAVERPGVYPLQGNTTVLQAVAMGGDCFSRRMARPSRSCARKASGRRHLSAASTSITCGLIQPMISNLPTATSWSSKAAP
jgi:Periplasmic protein involved in polysaccharide export